MQQAVLDVRSLVRWIEKRDQGPLLLAGVDLGGLVAGLTATVHEGLDGLAVIASHDRVSEMLWRGKADRGKFREAMEHAGVEQAQVDEAWSVLDPGWRPPLIPIERIRLIEGRYDDVEHACLDRLSRSWGNVAISRHTFAHADFPFFARPVIKEALGLIGIVES
jgi:pimeloyl-ACP methyl ester carboxylesterase